jgi:pimeloyl-ACP methyl ester carboxylesterase
MIRDVHKTLVEYGSGTNVTRLDYTSEYDGHGDWALVGGEESSATWVVFIHGHGSKADQLFTREDVRRDWLPAIKRRGAGIVSVHLRGNTWMNPAAVCDLHDVLAYLREHYSVRSFVFLSGSMGGTSNLIYATRHPEDVAGLIALGAMADLAKYYLWARRQSDSEILAEIADAIRQSYGGEPHDIPHIYDSHNALLHSNRLTMPVFFVHGQADALMPIEQARLFAEAKNTPNSFLFHEITDGNHDSPLRYAEEGLGWIGKQLQ